VLAVPLTILTPQDFGLLEVKATPSIKNKNGLYFMYDPNQSSAYTRPALWYLGINGNTVGETMRHRIIKHRRHALQLKSKSGNNNNWLQFSIWLQQKGHAGQNSIWDINCRVLWLEIPNATKQDLKLLESNCIETLRPIVNDTIDWIQLSTL
jgi:hypothetical protein